VTEITPEREMELLRKLEEANDRIRQLEEDLAAHKRKAAEDTEVRFKNQDEVA
jgi:hypothetical protein